MATAGALKITLLGEKELLRALEALPERVQRRVLRSAVAKATRPIVRAAKANAPARDRREDEEGRPVGPTGLLKKSIGYIIRTYPRTGTILAAVGARRGFKMVIDGKNYDPANYAHLVEFGHRIAVGGKLERLDARKPKRKRRGRAKPATGCWVGNVPARPFLTPAYKANEASSAAILREGIAAGIEREAAKLGAAAPKR